MMGEFLAMVHSCICYLTIRDICLSSNAYSVITIEIEEYTCAGNVPRCHNLKFWSLWWALWSTVLSDPRAELSGCHDTIATECSPLACLLSLDLWRWKMREMKRGPGRQPCAPTNHHIRQKRKSSTHIGRWI